ncbi:MAG: NADH-quinone oxidoreductase subunit L [Pseudomonadota bacterium]
MSGNASDLIMLSVPLLYLACALVAPALPSRAGWRVTQLCNLATLVLILAHVPLPDPISGWFLNDPLHLIVQGLVTFIGLIVARYASRYLEGEAGQPRFQRWLQLTLGCVMVVVTTNHVGVLLVAWAGISISLHQLLMFYPARKRAALAAHKKFLFARLAEICLVVAFAFLYSEHGTLTIDALMQSVGGPDGLSRLEHTAAVLIACAAMVKCAQFPMHGWLIQVVEAPTPVSALLHAGVINLGGFLLLLMAPLMSQASLANWLVLIVAGLTSVAAALITMTRVSIKVLLAWSTVAQMGLMLVECALGQYGLALLHLVAHSCYKAHAFLDSGSEVENYLKRQMAPLRLPQPQSIPLLVLCVLVFLGVLIAVGAASPDAGLWLLLAMSPILLLTERATIQDGGSLTWAAGLAAGIVALYAVLKTLFDALAPSSITPTVAQGGWFVFLVCLLIGLYWLLRHQGNTRLGRALYRNLYAGFYLDEWATRATLAIWPAQLPPRATRTRVFANELQETSS